MNRVNDVKFGCIMYRFKALSERKKCHTLLFHFLPPQKMFEYFILKKLSNFYLFWEVNLKYFALVIFILVRRISLHKNDVDLPNYYTKVKKKVCII